MDRLKQKLIAGIIMSSFVLTNASVAFADVVPAVNTPELIQQAEEVDVKNQSMDSERILKFEYLPKVKNVSSNMVTITNHRIIVHKGDVFKVAFAQDFTTKNLQCGEKVVFNLPCGLSTQEGRLLLPEGTQIVAEVVEYTPPKWWNRNAKVKLAFNEILVPNSNLCTMSGCVFAKNNVLQRSGWATFAKPFIWTASLFGVGAGLGAAFGAAAGNAATGCLAIGMPVGGGVGLLVGLATPGLHYKAKAGKQIPIMLNEDMTFYNTQE